LTQNRKRRLLVIDDDRLFCDAMSDFMVSDGLEVMKAHTLGDGLSFCSAGDVDVVLLDQDLPDGDGRAGCPDILHHNPQAKIIFITAYPSFESAVGAVKAGAFDYLSKPFEPEELRLTVDRALRVMDLEQIEEFQSFSRERESAENVLVGGDGGLAEAYGIVRLAASSDAPVLITGETGTGKSALAREVHRLSEKGRQAFVAINCASLPAELIEAELFGHEKGAFTGADGRRKGIFEMADGGTLLLDEIGEMPVHLQTKLLSVLEDGVIRRVGSDRERRVDVRVIAATNKDLERAVDDGRFRSDLFYRLNVVNIHVPPLRERKHDIPELCKLLLKKSKARRGVQIPDYEIEALVAYDWPGNVRELKNVIERALILQRGERIRPSVLLGRTRREEGQVACMEDSPHQTDSVITLQELEKKHIQDTLERFSGNITRTAEALGISLSTLKRRLKEYGR